MHPRTRNGTVSQKYLTYQEPNLASEYEGHPHATRQAHCTPSTHWRSVSSHHFDRYSLRIAREYRRRLCENSIQSSLYISLTRQ